MRLYLASTSPARLALLQAAGISPLQLASHVDEAAVVAAAGKLTPKQTVALLARKKAEAVWRDHAMTDGVVLGCDSMFELHGALLGKPHDPDTARERWREQRGQTGILHTGHWLVDARAQGPVRAVGKTVSSAVTFAALSDDEVDSYVASGEPLKVAGGFTLDGLGGAFVSEVSGDPSAVIGLSLPGLRELLIELGLSITDFWEPMSL